MIYYLIIYLSFYFAAKDLISLKKQALFAAFPYTLPVLTGYLFLGIAFGVLLASKGFSPWWALIMSLFIYAGAMQFVAISLLTGPFAPLTAAIITLMVNARHLFYGLSLLTRFRALGKAKAYPIFALTDETYSLYCLTKAPEGVSAKWFDIWIAVLDHSYWIIGGLIGAVIGTHLPFDATGIDFAMTALFAVIFLEQWDSFTDRRPAVCGLAVTLLCLLIFGKEWFVIASMIALLALLTLGRSRLEVKKA